MDVIVKGKQITVSCKSSQENDIESYLLNLANKTTQLKEFSAFDLYINDDGYFKDKFDFWWDITNDLMFWKKNLKFESKMQSCIHPTQHKILIS